MGPISVRVRGPGRHGFTLAGTTLLVLLLLAWPPVSALPALARPTTFPVGSATVAMTGGGTGGAGDLPSALTFPWWGGVDYRGANLSGAAGFLGNVTLPSTDPDTTGFNYTVGIGASDDVCSWASAGLEDSGGIWRFHASLVPFGGAVEDHWALHLAPGDTYQLLVGIEGGMLVSEVFNVSAGNLYPSSSTPDAGAQLADGATALLVGPSTCGGHSTSLEANLTVRAASGAAGTPSRDLFVQDEGVFLSAAPLAVLAIPNLWTPFFHQAPAAFSPEQSWSTSDLLVLVTTHPALALATTTAPPTDLDVGMSFGVGIVGTPRTLNVGANANTYVFSQIEFGGGYPGTSSLTFANCQSLNGSNSNAGYPGGDTGIPAEYGYASNTTLSDIYLGFALDPTTNLSVDYRCFTNTLSSPGNVSVWGVSYLTYDLLNPPTLADPATIFVDALSSGPREQLAMNALAWNVWVHPLPTISASVPSPVVLVGKSVTFNALERGGSPTLTYTWYVDGSAQPGCTTTSCTLSWGAVGSHQVWVDVRDAYGNTAVSAHLNETVDPSMSASVSPSPNAVGTVGVGTAVAATVVGGAGGNSYTFFVNGSASPTSFFSGPSGTATFTPLHPAVYQLWVAANDSYGNVAVAPHTNLTVAEGVTAILSPTSTRTEIGSTPALLALAVGGGSAPYTVTWQVPGLTVVGSPCAATCNLTASTPGVYPVWAVVVDASGRTSVSPHANLSVLAPPSFSAWRGPAQVDQGSNDTFRATFVGGGAPFTYQWSLNGTPLPYCQATSDCSVAFPTGAWANLFLNLTDALGGAASAPPFHVTVVAPLTVSFQPAPALQVEVGVTTNLSGVATGGVGTRDSYGFLSSAAGGTVIAYGSSSTASWTPLAVGALQVWVEANDTTGFRAVSPHANVSVLPSVLATLSPSPTASLAAGATLNATVTVTGGLGPFAYAWSSDGTPVGSCSTTPYCAFRWTSPGSHQILVGVFDALGGRSVTPPTNVTVGVGRTVLVKFLAGPPGTGTLSVNGVLTASGTTSQLLAGSYALLATPSPGFYFAGWNLSNPSTLAVTSLTSASTVLQLSGAGNVTAEFAGPSLFGMGVIVTPTGRANVSVNGSAFAGGSSTTLREGVYPVEALPGPGFSFAGWFTTGGVQVVSNAPTTLLEISGNGTLSLDVLGSGVGTLYQVAFSTSPSGVGATFTFGSTAYTPGTAALVAASSYPVSLSIPSGYAFRSWSSTGGVSVSNPSAASTIVTVQGNGTLVANLQSTSGGGLFGLPISALEVMGLLLVVIVVLVAVGVARHRSHRPPQAEAPSEGRSSLPAGVTSSWDDRAEGPSAGDDEDGL